MSLPVISTLPPAPARTMTNDEFIAKADAFVAALGTFQSEINTFGVAVSAVAAALGVSGADAELSALAGLTSAANKLPYFTGSGTAALADFTAFARTLVDDADAATMRTTLGLGALALLATINGGNWSGTDLAVADGGTGASSASGARSNLGLVIGTDVQAYDSDLASIAALATTTFGRSLLTQADAPAALATLGALSISSSSLGNPGYVKLSNGLHIMWGTFTASGGQSATSVSYPSGVSLTTFSVAVCSAAGTNTDAQSNFAQVNGTSTTGFTYNSNVGGVTGFYIGVGV